MSVSVGEVQLSLYSTLWVTYFSLGQQTQFEPVFIFVRQTAHIYTGERRRPAAAVVGYSS